MRIAAVVILIVAALGFGAATAVVRNAPTEDKLMYWIGALSVPMLLLVVGMVLWELGGRRPPTQP